ncbi:MAG: dehydratase medium subunit [Firmicutes bacterium]|nr:dehydratase medium subunit [Bacillota bacterium]
MRESTPDKPSISIYVKSHAGQQEKIREIQAGLEEEGVPSSVKTGEDDAVTLSYRGAIESQLEVGIGLDAAVMSVHFRKLPSDNPLFLSRDKDNPAAWRYLGYNAARLVKGIPFKPLPEQSTTGGNSELKQLITNIVHNIISQKL